MLVPKIDASKDCVSLRNNIKKDFFVPMNKNAIISDSILTY